MAAGALHLYGPHLAEVRSIVVRPEARVTVSVANYCTRCLGEAEDHGVGCVCLFTRIPDFFFRYGVPRGRGPHRPPGQDLQGLPETARVFRSATEVAMARGQVPKVSILGPGSEAEQLVRMTV